MIEKIKLEVSLLKCFEDTPVISLLISEYQKVIESTTPYTLLEKIYYNYLWKYESLLISRKFEKCDKKIDNLILDYSFIIKSFQIYL